MTPHISSEHHIAVETHPEIIHGDRQVVHIFFPDRLPRGISIGDSLKEESQIPVCQIGQPGGPAISVQTSFFAAITGIALRMDHHMAKFSGPAVGAHVHITEDTVPDIQGHLHLGILAEDDGSSHAVAQQQVADAL